MKMRMVGEELHIALPYEGAVIAVRVKKNTLLHDLGAYGLDQMAALCDTINRSVAKAIAEHEAAKAEPPEAA